MVFVALFGPPGVGKTDLVLLANSMGIPAYDIESFGSSYEERKQIFLKHIETETSPYVLYGAADMKLHDFPSHTISILLLPPQDEYEKRVQGRDDIYPHKAGQHSLDCYHHFAENRNAFDIVFDQVVSDKTLLEEILTKTRYTEQTVHTI